MKAADLRAKSESDLKSELIDLLRAQFSLRMQVATQQLDKVDQIGKWRREIARVRTILAQKARQA